MAYITVQQAAEKWRISQRLTQRLCRDGRVPGARKFSGTWAIPAGACKPADPRKERKQTAAESAVPWTEPDQSAAMRVPMPLLNGAFIPGYCLEYVESLEDQPLRDIARAEYYYFSGRTEEAAWMAERYLEHPDLALRLSACLISAYANLSNGQIPQARRALNQAKLILVRADEQTPPLLRAAAVFIVATAAVLLHLPLPEEADSLAEQLRLLPPGLRMFALYVEAHHTYLQGDYGKSVGIVETALAMQIRCYPIPTIYLHLAAVMDYMSLKQPDRAQAHLLAALELAKPDGLFEALGEHHGLLGGMLEAVLKRDWPEEFKRIIAITYRFSAGWRKVHNPATGETVADNLSTTEFAAAMLAARGWTNQEIGNHIGLSASTVKHYISSALQKLGIKQRKDLKGYLLR